MFTLVLGTAWAQDSGPAPGSASAEARSSYTLQPLDDIEIRAYNIPELNTALKIRPDGRIAVLLLDEITAAGKTPEELSQLLTTEYSKHFRKPKITVVVRSFAAQSVYVGGEVTKAGAVPLRSGLTAVQAVVGAGGLKETVSGDEVLIVHDAGTQTEKTEVVNVNDVLKRRRPDTVLKPSDIIYVQKSYVNVFVGGEVAKPGLVPLGGNMTMLTAILEAGGFKETAKASAVVLIRDNGNDKPEFSKVKMDDVMVASAHTKLKPYDVIYVPKSRIAKIDKAVDQWVRQLSPAILSFGFSYLIGQGVTTTIF